MTSAHRGGAPEFPSPEPAGGLGFPGWVLPVSLVGLALLLVSTLPALVARRSLERAERRLADEVRSMQATTERVQRERQALLSDEFVLDVAMRELLEPGPRLALSRPSPAVVAPRK